MINIRQIEKGVANYLDAELLNKSNLSTLEKLFAGTTISIGIKRYSKLIQGYTANPIMQKMELVNENGDIDADLLLESLKENVPKEGISFEIPILGNLQIKPNDVDVLYDYILKAGNK